MRGDYLIAVLLCAAQAYVLAAAPSARAQGSGSPTLSPPSPEPLATPQDQPPLAAATAPPQSATDPVVAIVRAKLADPVLRKGANADDLAALEAFYRERIGP